jgi:S1-C subfamily serine protease
MKRYIVLLFWTIIAYPNLIGQSNNLVKATYSPKMEYFTQNTRITAVSIYEQTIVVSISITNWQYSNFLRISSKSFLSDYNNLNDKFPIQGILQGTLDQTYNFGKKGDVNNMDLVFTRVSPGIEKINITLNPEDAAPFLWRGVAIINPDNHPKTNWTEETLKSDWNKNGLTAIEGIYEATSSEILAGKYKVAVKKNSSSSYQLIYLSGATVSTWKVGQIKAELTETATPQLYKTRWFMGNKVPTENCYITFEQGLMKVNYTDANQSESVYLKLYPTFSNDVSPKGIQASGTGFALTSDGMIVTNNHVIEGASDITIRGINGEFDNVYKGRVVVADKNNDLAIIKIDDTNFSSCGKIPYTIRANSASTGESVFVLGYPLISTMGQEIKLTNGIISSKSGFQGDITSYQISVPVQPGNSGGPLFDNQGNLIGIINAKHVGAENVSYAIKVNYLISLIDLLDNRPPLQNASSLNGKALTQQVDILRKFIYIIEVN